MSQIVLDTDVWSFLFKRDTRAELYRSQIEGHVLAVSFQTVAELYQWAAKTGWGETQRNRLDNWLSRFVVLSYDQQTARLWAQLRVERERIGQPLAAQDAWVAACAIRHNCPLLTHNTADYVHLPLLTVISKIP